MVDIYVSLRQFADQEAHEACDKGAAACRRRDGRELRERSAGLTVSPDISNGSLRWKVEKIQECKEIIDGDLCRRCRGEMRIGGKAGPGLVVGCCLCLRRVLPHVPERDYVAPHVSHQLPKPHSGARSIDKSGNP